MSSVYPLYTHPSTLCTVEDYLTYLQPRIDAHVRRRHGDLSYDLQQELIQAGLVNIWEDYRRGKLSNTDPLDHWMQAGKTGLTRALENLLRETGVRVRDNGDTYIENRIALDCDLTPEDSSRTGLEQAEAAIHRQPGPCDPEGGHIDWRIDFERLYERAICLLDAKRYDDCLAVIHHLAEGAWTVTDFQVLNGWGDKRYYKALHAIQAAFYAAAGKDLSTRPVYNGRKINHQAIVDLWQQGYGCRRIARRVGCSQSRVDQVIQGHRRQGTLPERSTRRQYNHGKLHHAGAAI